MTQQDEHLWDEEVVEIFLDLDRSGRDYYELEINPANVVCDLRMISPWPDKKGDIDWNLAGLETRVHARKGARAETRGWTATALPALERACARCPRRARSRCPRSPATPGASTSSASSGRAGQESPGEGRGVRGLVAPVRCRASTTPAAFRDLVFVGAAR